MGKIISFVLGLLGKFIDFYKKHKDVFYIVIIAIILLSGYLFIRNQKKEVVIVDPHRPYYDSIFKVIEDRNGKMYSEIRTLRIENTHFISVIDSLAKAIKVKPKYIKGEDRYIYKIDTTFEVKPYPIVIARDTVYNVRKQDNYIDVNAFAGKNYGSISVKSVDTLIRIETSKTNIWGKTTDNVLLRNTNPYNYLQSGYSYSKIQKRVVLSLGPAIIYDPFRNQFSLGVSLQYPLIQIKK